MQAITVSSPSLRPSLTGATLKATLAAPGRDAAHAGGHLRLSLDSPEGPSVPVPFPLLLDNGRRRGVPDRRLREPHYLSFRRKDRLAAAASVLRVVLALQVARRPEEVRRPDERDSGA